MSDWYQELIATPSETYDPRKLKAYDYSNTTFYHDFRGRPAHVSISSDGPSGLYVWTRWPNRFGSDLFRNYQIVLGDAGVSLELTKTTFGFDDSRNPDPELALDGFSSAEAACIRKVEKDTGIARLLAQSMPEIERHYLKAQLEHWRRCEDRHATLEEGFSAQRVEALSIARAIDQASSHLRGPHAQQARSRYTALQEQHDNCREAARESGAAADRARHNADKARESALIAVNYFSGAYPSIRFPGNLVAEATRFVAVLESTRGWQEPPIDSRFL